MVHGSGSDLRKEQSFTPLTLLNMKLVQVGKKRDLTVLGPT